MGRIQCFEDIEAWKRARELAKELYRVSGEGALARDYGLRDQIRRAGVSVLTDDAKEGLAAFMDKRAPQWKHK